MYTLGAIRLCLLSLLVAATACNSKLPQEIEVPTANPARLRIVNAAPGIQNVEVVRNGVATPIAQNLNYGAFTQSCVSLPANVAHTLTFRSGGADLAAGTFTPDAGVKYSAYLTGSGTTRRVVIAPDATTATTGNNGVRLINASSGAGDVYVTTPAGDPVLASRVFGNMGVTALGNPALDYYATETTRTRVRLYDVDATTGTPRADLTLSGLPASRLVTVVLADLASAGPSASFLTFPC